MSNELFLISLSFLTIVSLFSSLVFVIGIVWRVEMELDLSFKFFAFAVLFLLMTEGLSLLPASRLEMQWQFVLPVVKFLAATNLLLGLYFMRDLVRRLDGEKNPNPK